MTFGAGPRKALAVERTVSLRDQAVAGLVAGIAGGILIELCFFAVALASGTPAGKLPQSFAFIAAVLMGPGAYANPAAVPIGIVLHFCVAVGWALGYVYLARTQPHLLTRPIISGAGFGLMVYIFMQIVLLTAGEYHRPAPGALATQLIAHIVFFGIPVGLIVARMLRRA